MYNSFLLTYDTDVKRCYNISFLGESGGEWVTSEEIMRNIGGVRTRLVLHH